MRIGITQGDVNGVGYEVIFKALEEPEMLEGLTPIIYGSPKAAAYHRKVLEMPGMGFNEVTKPSEARPGRINILPCGDDNVKVELGVSSELAGRAAFEALDAAVRDLTLGDLDAIVTAPINKKNIQSETFQFPGHTEYLEQACQSPALMLLCAGALRVGVVAGHMPLSQVPAFITQERILDKLRILRGSLVGDFGVTNPRVAVLSLNPHAGDGGLLGTEERDVISPAIAAAVGEGIQAFGPFPADGFFGSDLLGKFDAVLAMYHDQGLAPFKALAFDQGVNFTAGLPVVRTSPDHGTAYDIAGKNVAAPDSMRHAIWLALDVARNRRQQQELEAGKLVEEKKANNYPKR